MDDIFRKLEFRPFSYETDPEFVVDMFRAFEILEGSWFDAENTCRMYQKIVSRVSGTSWVLSFSRAVIAYADIVSFNDRDAFVTRWAVHPDFQHPKVSRKMLDGLIQEAAKRKFNSLTLFAGNPESFGNFESIGLKRDRLYQWVMTGDVQTVPGITANSMNKGREAIDEDFLPFLGSPLPPRFSLAKAFMAAGYGVFNYRSPDLIKIEVAGVPYFAFHDGREWFVFRKSRNPKDSEAIEPILGALGAYKMGRILLSEKAYKMAQALPASREMFWDYFLEI